MRGMVDSDCLLGGHTKTNTVNFQCLRSMLNFPNLSNRLTLHARVTWGSELHVRESVAGSAVHMYMLHLAHTHSTHQTAFQCPQKYWPVSVKYWVCAAADPVRLLDVKIVWLVKVRFSMTSARIWWHNKKCASCGASNLACLPACAAMSVEVDRQVSWWECHGWV